MGSWAYLNMFSLGRGLRWDQKKSLELVLISSIYFVSLRVSLDLLRNTLGVSLLLFALAASRNIKNRQSAIAFSALALLVTATHLLVATLLLALILVDVIRSRDQRVRKMLCAIPSLAAYLLSLVEIQLLGVGIFVEQTPSLQSLFVYGFRLYIFLPLIPLAYYGLTDFPHGPMKNWLLICVAGLIIGTTPVAVSSALVDPYCWSLLMFVPVLVLATQGLARLRLPVVSGVRVRRMLYRG